MDFDLIGGGVVDMTPEPIETTGGGSVGGDFGLTTVAEGAIGEDGAEESEGIFIIRTSQDGDEVRGVGLGLTDLESETGAAHAINSRGRINLVKRVSPPVTAGNVGDKALARNLIIFIAVGGPVLKP